MSIAHEYQGILDAHRREMDRCLEEFDDAYARQMEHFKEVVKKAEAAGASPAATVADLNTDTPETQQGLYAGDKEQSAPTASGQPHAASPPRRGKIRSIRIDR